MHKFVCVFFLSTPWCDHQRNKVKTYRWKQYQLFCQCLLLFQLWIRECEKKSLNHYNFNIVLCALLSFPEFVNVFCFYFSLAELLPTENNVPPLVVFQLLLCVCDSISGWFFVQYGIDSASSQQYSIAKLYHKIYRIRRSNQ